MSSIETPARDEAETLRAFIALSFDPAVRSALARAGRDLQREPWAEEVRWVPSESLHLTLRFLGDIAVSGVPGLLEALSTRMRSVEPFSCSLSGLALFPSPARPRVVAALVTQAQQLGSLAAIVEQVEEAVVAAGYRAETRHFRAHITLGRFRRGKRRGLEIGAELSEVSLAVNDVVLFRSTLGPSGARYTELGRAPLAVRPNS